MNPAQDFLEHLFEGMDPDAHTIITGFGGDPNTADRNLAAKMWRGIPWQPGQAVPAVYAIQNAYFTVSSFLPTPEGERRRRIEQCARMHCVMVDDLGSKVGWDRLLLPPSALIETSPDNYQGILLLADEPAARDRQLCKLLIDRMVAAGLTQDGSDPGMKGVTRFARLPIGINAKAKYVKRLGHPFNVRLHKFEPTRRYSFADIAGAWRLDMTPEPQRPVRPLTPDEQAAGMGRFEQLLKTFQLLGWYHGTNGAWHQVTCPWRPHHTDRADNGTAVTAPSASNNGAGGFKCNHGHCAERTIGDVYAWLRELAKELKAHD